MSTPGVSHPSPTTAEDFRRVLDERAVQPFVRPDLIKLDMRLLRGRTTAEAAHIVNSVRARAERTDAVVLAEGIETNKHAREAVAAGATLGQGFLFGHPGPLPSPLPPPGRAIPLRPARAAGAGATPGRWWRPPGSRAWPPRTCWSRCACS
jgi:predicted signal transduction protein with EAL and GGDEF domain